jgi:hypothetical protein
MIVMLVVVAISFGMEWLIDILDGDAKLPEKNISFVDVIKSGTAESSFADRQPQWHQGTPLSHQHRQ